MQEIKFYHSQRSAVVIAIVYGLLFILSFTVTSVFLSDLIHDLTSSKAIILVGLSIFPITLTALFGWQFIKNLKNNKPLCTLTPSEFIYTEFYYKTTTTKRIPIGNIKKVKMRKTLIDRKITISLELYNHTNLLKLTYLTGFLTEKDKKILMEELEKRISMRGYL